MEKEEQLFRKRIQELAENAYSRDIPLHTDFLTLAEQTVFQNMSATLPPVKFVLSGGFPMSERKVLCFLASYEEELYAPPFVCLKIAPANRRFAEELTHRDYLGAIMNLGIERSMIGDIVLQDGNAWAFVIEKMSRYLAENLTMIRHTSVVTEITADFSELPEPEMEEISGTVSSCVYGAVDPVQDVGTVTMMLWYTFSTFTRSPEIPSSSARISCTVAVPAGSTVV